jgi:hypothetical protein
VYGGLFLNFAVSTIFNDPELQSHDFGNGSAPNSGAIAIPRMTMKKTIDTDDLFISDSS